MKLDRDERWEYLADELRTCCTRPEAELSCPVIWDGSFFCSWGDIMLMLSETKSKKQQLGLFVYLSCPWLEQSRALRTSISFGQ